MFVTGKKQEEANMADTEPKGMGALLVGSVPLANAEAVFRAAVSALGDRLRRVPDGETGERINWIEWQFPVMSSRPFFEVVPPDPKAYRASPALRLQPGVRDRDISFERLGYAEAARSSYRVFERLQREGVIPASMRFQVSLPTPLAPVGGFVLPESQAAVQPAYTAGLLAELEEIAGAVPHGKLAIQWDVAVEMAILEGVFPTSLKDPKTEIPRLLAELGDSVPGGVELGYHLCYGDLGHRHFKEPADAGRLVEVANAVSALVKRKVQWMHMPVPRGRTDSAYFEPLRNLKLGPETELYLGLVHYTDGVEGTKRRIRAVRPFVGSFGVATECGLGRRPQETISELLKIHAAVSEPLPRR
jgi:hypothetical protein